LDVEPDARLTLADGPQPVTGLLAQLEAADRDGVRPTDLTLLANGKPADRGPTT
jgi:2-amino-4-hydroxy-6-hydroxymethyldihydropteridine diphosphokinase